MNPQSEAHYNAALRAAQNAWDHYLDVCLGIHHKKLSKETANPALNDVIHTGWALKEAASQPPPAPLPQRNRKEETTKPSNRKAIKPAE